MKNTIVLFFVLFIFSNCKKTEQLPAATHTGSNILACKINGKIFISSGAGGKFSQLGAGVLYGVSVDSTAYINATTENPHYQITINSRYNFTLGPYQFGPYHYNNGAEYDDDTNGTLPTGGNQYFTDSTHSGSVTYTYYDGNILAGTFAFDAVNGAGSVVHITEGRFDIANH